MRAERSQRAARAAIEIGYPPLIEDDRERDLDLTGEMPVVPPQPRAPAAPVAPVDDAPVEAPSVAADPVVQPVAGGWDMVPTTLPTYVSKPAAQRRTVSTIDLDSTGVWSSGHNDEDSALARSAEKSARTAREADETRRASGA